MTVNNFVDDPYNRRGERKCSECGILPLRMPYDKCGGVRCTNENRKISCVVCFDEVTAFESVMCSSGHAMCHKCFEPYVKDICDTASEKEITALSAEERRDFGRVHCPCRGVAGGCTAMPFTDGQVFRALSQAAASISFSTTPKALDQYLETKTLLRVAESTEKAFADAQDALQVELSKLKNQPQTGADGISDDAGNFLLSKQLKKLMPNARQCKMCSYGPMDFRACSDLSAHHNQLVGNVAIGGDENNVREVRLDNACPRCGWFSRERKNWPKWNGNISTDALPAGATPFEKSDWAARTWYPKIAAAEKIADECRARARNLEADLKATESRLLAEKHAREEAEAEAKEADERAMLVKQKITTSEIACMALSSKLHSQLERERNLRRAAEQRARKTLPPLPESPRSAL